MCVLYVYSLRAQQKHDMSLGNKPFETRDLVPYLYHACGTWS